MDAIETLGSIKNCQQAAEKPTSNHVKLDVGKKFCSRQIIHQTAAQMIFFFFFAVEIFFLPLVSFYTMSAATLQHQIILTGSPSHVTFPTATPASTEESRSSRSVLWGCSPGTNGVGSSHGPLTNQEHPISLGYPQLHVAPRLPIFTPFLHAEAPTKLPCSERCKRLPLIFIPLGPIENTGPTARQISSKTFGAEPSYDNERKSSLLDTSSLIRCCAT